MTLEPVQCSTHSLVDKQFSYTPSIPRLVIRRYAFCFLVIESRYRFALLQYLGWFLGPHSHRPSYSIQMKSCQSC